LDSIAALQPIDANVDSPRSRPEPTLLRDHLVAALGCSHFELGRLLRERIAPLPVRIDGVILWYEDEAKLAAPRCRDAVAYWRRRREQQGQQARSAA
jgi:hypothetical protein